MKQAFTNTIRGGSSRNPLAIATGSKKSGTGGKKSTRQSKQQVPKCAYGAACTRKGCAYRHPPRNSANEFVYESYHEDPQSKICKPYLAGMCTYGHKCLNRHPSPEEADAVRAKYKQKSCSYGDGCQTEGCLYFHPWEALENANGSEQESHYVDQNNSSNALYSGDHLYKAMEGLDMMEGSIHSQQQQPTYDQWLAMDCPPPPTIDPAHIHNMWHYPGSGMQRTPWEVYSLMYPHHHAHSLSNTIPTDSNLISGNINSLNAATPSWKPTAVTATNFNATAPSWKPDNANTSISNNTNQVQIEEDPKTFQEWKKKGCPYPSWWYESEYQNHDPWYDDEGIRRSLEEVYEVLYGENAKEIAAGMVQNNMYACNDVSEPTPAELATMTQTDNHFNASHTGHHQFPNNENHSPPKGGWASIAAMRPGPVASSIGSINNTFSSPGGNSKNISTATNNSKSHNMVVIPKEVWLPNTSNSDYFHLYPDAIERFLAVNGHHKSYLASITIPKSFESSNNANSNLPNGIRKSKEGSVTLLDVHFQSTASVAIVLDRFLYPTLTENEEVWIITGSGHHVPAAGHQRRDDGKVGGGGLLFNSVRRYLEDGEGEMGWEWRIGKDTSGGRNKSGGAFLVRIIPS